MPLGRTTAATGALIGATVIWGSTFVVTKRSLAEMTPEVFLAWRFGLAAAVLLALRPRRVRLLSGRDWWRSGVLGLLLAGGFMLQTFGLERTSAGLSGFLTGTAVILTPVAKDPRNPHRWKVQSSALFRTAPMAPEALGLKNRPTT